MLLFFIKRKNIPTLKSIEINGVNYNLGILKDFKKNPRIKDFTLENSILSMVITPENKGKDK